MDIFATAAAASKDKITENQPAEKKYVSAAGALLIEIKGFDLMDFFCYGRFS